MRTRKRCLIAVIAVAMGCLLSTAAQAQFQRDPEVIKAHDAGVAALQAGEWEAAVQAFDQGIASMTVRLPNSISVEPKR